MRRLLLPAIALGFSMLPLASGSAAPNGVSASSLTAVVEPSASISHVNYGYWHGRRYGYWHGPYGHRYGYWRGPYGHRYGYWHRPYGYRYGYGRYWRG